MLVLVEALSRKKSRDVFGWRAVFLFEFKGEIKRFPLKKPLVLYSNLKIQNQYLQVEWVYNSNSR
jgi:hypothetical protein